MNNQKKVIELMKVSLASLELSADTKSEMTEKELRNFQLQVKKLLRTQKTLLLLVL